MPDLGSALFPDHLERKLSETMDQSQLTMATVNEAVAELEKRLERIELRLTAMMETSDTLMRNTNALVQELRAMLPDTLMQNTNALVQELRTMLRGLRVGES